MSTNQGKDGEMRFSIALAGAAIRENDLDYIRSSVTNQADFGVDYRVQGRGETLLSLCETATGRSMPAVAEAIGDLSKRTAARVDVKTTSSKLTRVTVTKFVADIPKHPDVKVHLLVGGSELSKSAATQFEQHQKIFADAGTALVYLANGDAARLANEYKQEILSTLAGPTGNS